MTSLKIFSSWKTCRYHLNWIIVSTEGLLLLVDIEMLMLSFSRFVATPKEMLLLFFNSGHHWRAPREQMLHSWKHTQRTEMVGLGLRKSISSDIHFRCRRLLLLLQIFQFLASFFTHRKKIRRIIFLAWKSRTSWKTGVRLWAANGDDLMMKTDTHKSRSFFWHKWLQHNFFDRVSRLLILHTKGLAFFKRKEGVKSEFESKKTWCETNKQLYLKPTAINLQLFRSSVLLL